MNKTKKYILFGLITIIVVLGIGTTAYKNYNSIENQSKRILQNDITSWYYSVKSLAYDDPSQPKSQQDRDKAIDLFRITKKLDNNWQLVSENYEVNYLGYSAVVVDTTYTFENKEKLDHQVFDERYYYDLDESIPVPLTQETTSIDKNEKFKTIDKNTLWNGDFDAWCKKTINSNEVEL